MILKVRSDLQGENGWLVIGELKNVSWRDELFVGCYAELLGVGEVGDYLVFDNPFTKPKADEPTSDPNKITLNCKRITITYKNEKTVDVWFNDIAYLMNDDGKTVETIYGY